MLFICLLFDLEVKVLKNKNFKLISNSILYILLSVFVCFFYDYLYSLYNENYQILPLGKNLKYIFIFSIFLSFISRFFTRMIIVSLVVLCSFFQFCNFQYFGNYIQPVSFLQIFTNTGEVFESLYPIVSEMIVPLLISFLGWFSLLILNKKMTGKIWKVKFGLLILVLGLFAHLFYSYNHLQPIDGRIDHKTIRKIYPKAGEHSFSNYIRSLNIFLVGIAPQKILGVFPDFAILPAPVLTEKKLNRNIVLVIGESLRSDRLSLYGYDNKTTPHLDLLKNKTSFYSKPIFSGGVMTKTSLNVIFNRLKYPGMQQTIDGKNNLFKSAKNNKFVTHFISNQSKSQLRVIDLLMSHNDIDFYYNKEDISNNLDKPTGYDEDLLSMLKKIDLSKNNFIVLHQRGSHSPYKNQYPKYFDKLQSEYENTILYTDFVLNNTIKYLKQNSKKETDFIFVSDHGELLGENGKSGHGWFNQIIYTVPFIFSSFNTNKNYSKKVASIKSHFGVSNLITNLLGYNVKRDENDKKDLVYINGSDLDGLAGYLEISVDNNIISKRLIR